MPRLTARNTLSAIGLALAILLISMPRAQAELLDDLILYYDFEDSTIQNKAPGFSGDYLPTVTGSPTSGYAGTTAGRTQLLAGKALNMTDSTTVTSSGTNLDQLRVTLGSGTDAKLPGSNLGNDFSISVWSYLSPATINRNDRFYVFEPSVGYDISWGTSPSSAGPSDVYLGYLNESAVANSPSISLARQTWHHIVHTFEPGVTAGNIMIKEYVDGVLVGSRESAYSSFSFQNMNFGNARDGTNRSWDGLLDELAIWDRTLTGAEVGTVYQTGLAGQSLLNPVPEPSTLALGASMLVGLGFWQVRKSRRLP